MASLRYNICTDSTEIFFSKLRSAVLNYHLPKLSFFTDPYCAGGGGGGGGGDLIRITYSFDQHLDSPKKELLIISSLVRNVLYLNTDQLVLG